MAQQAISRTVSSNPSERFEANEIRARLEAVARVTSHTDSSAAQLRNDLRWMRERLSETRSRTTDLRVVAASARWRGMNAIYRHVSYTANSNEKLETVLAAAIADLELALQGVPE